MIDMTQVVDVRNPDTGEHYTTIDNKTTNERIWNILTPEPGYNFSSEWKSEGEIVAGNKCPWFEYIELPDDKEWSLDVSISMDRTTMFHFDGYTLGIQWQQPDSLHIMKDNGFEEKGQTILYTLPIGPCPDGEYQNFRLIIKNNPTTHQWNLRLFRGGWHELGDIPQPERGTTRRWHFYYAHKGSLYIQQVRIYIDDWSVANIRAVYKDGEKSKSVSHGYLFDLARKIYGMETATTTTDRTLGIVSV